MSERLKSTSAVSNKDVIDELTQNIESNLLPGDKSDFSSADAEEFVINPPQSSDSFANLPSGSGDEPKKSKGKAIIKL